MEKVRAARRVREAAPAYESEAAAPDVYTMSLGGRGRLVLPAAVRERLKIKEGDRITLRVEQDGTMKLQTPAVFARSLLGIFKDIAPGRSLVDELIADRRREAAREEREYREAVAASSGGVRRRKRAVR